MSICLIDTSVFCNVIRVPNRDQHHAAVMARLKQLITDKTTLLLPMAAVVETGNHIAQNGDGRERRQAAERFVNTVTEAMGGNAPWTPTPFLELASLQAWLAEYPDRAMSGLGLGDLTMVKEWERQCALHRGRRVFIWSLDKHLRTFDRAPEIG
jgi:predicted nucleic acid-binding protein